MALQAPRPVNQIDKLGSPMVTHRAHAAGNPHGLALILVKRLHNVPMASGRGVLGDTKRVDAEGTQLSQFV
jgi:hypothetical protein